MKPPFSALRPRVPAPTSRTPDPPKPRYDESEERTKPTDPTHEEIQALWSAFGFLTPAHRLVLIELATLFPKLSPADIERIVAEAERAAGVL
jgi:hypothetical protein